MAGIVIKGLPEFQATLKRYAAVSKKTIPEIVNKKALFISRGALWQTKKSDKEAIKQDLLELAYKVKTSASGKSRKFHKMSSTAPEAPIAAILINWKRGQQGRAGLFGEAMKKAVKGFIGSRQRSVAYIRSGWLPAIKALNPFVRSKAGARPLDSQTKQFGKPKGKGVPAREGWSVRAVITNSIAEGSSKESQHHERALTEYGEPALERAVKEEQASTEQEIERRFRENARLIGIRTD